MSEHKTFQQHMNGHFPLITATLSDISDDRRPWVTKQVGNTLLFRAGASYVYYRKNPARHASSLNEALILRELAASLYQNQEQYDKDALAIFEALSPNAPVKLETTKKVKVPAFVKERQEQIAKEAIEEDALMQKILPHLRGFLDGASYEYIDVQPSEFMHDRAHLAAAKAFQAMQDRVEQDITFIAKKWTSANEAQNIAEREKWEGEGFFAEQDLETVSSAISQGGFALED
jgi:hypothetical protein